MPPDDPHAALLRGLRDADATFTSAPVSVDVDRRVLAITERKRPHHTLAFASVALVAFAAVFLVTRSDDGDLAPPIARAAERASPVLVVDTNGDVRALAVGTDVGTLTARVALLPMADELAWIESPWGRIETTSHIEVLVDARELTVAAGEGTLERAGEVRALAMGDRVAIEGDEGPHEDGADEDGAHEDGAHEVAPKDARVRKGTPSPSQPREERFDLTREIRAVQDLVLQGRFADADTRIGELMGRTTDSRARAALSAERVQVRLRSGSDVCAALTSHVAVVGSLGPDLAALSTAKGCGL